MSAAERSHLNCSFKTVSDLHKKRRVVGMIGGGSDVGKAKVQAILDINRNTRVLSFSPFLIRRLPVGPAQHAASPAGGSCSS